MKASFGRIKRLWFNLLLLALAGPWAPSPNAQSTNAVPEGTDTSGASPPARQYISPFSGVALPAYSYTNTNSTVTSWLGNRGLAVDPFSLTPLPGSEKVEPTIPRIEPIDEPATPVILNLPPAASIHRGLPVPVAIPSGSRARRVAPAEPLPAPAALFAVEFAESARFEFPPGSTLRRK